MSNMSYCRFENTYLDLLDCYENIEAEISETETKYKEKIIKLCVDIAIDFGDCEKLD